MQAFHIPGAAPLYINTVRIFGSNVRRRIFFRKDIRMSILQTANSQKKWILWTFGLIPVLLIKVFAHSVTI